MPTTSLLPPRSRAQISMSGISFARAGIPVLNQVDITVTAASRLASVGENGAGKSTLLYLLAGRLEPDSGTMVRAGSVAIAEQEMPHDDDRTVGDVVAKAIAPALAALAELDEATEAMSLGDKDAGDRLSQALERVEILDAWDAERRVRLALTSLSAEHDFRRPLAALSVGQRYRVRLACLLGARDDFLLLDEPTNHLDREGLDFLTASLKDRVGGVAIVSHDRALLADVAEQFVDLDPTPDGRPRTYGDGYEGYREGRRALSAKWEQNHAEQVAEGRRLAEDLSVAQNRLRTGWRPDKGTGKHQRATRAGGIVRNVRRRQADLEAHEIRTPAPPQVFRLPSLRVRKNAMLVTARDVTFEDRLPTPVSLELLGGDRLVVSGPNGAGKSTLLSLLADRLSPSQGRVWRAEDVCVGYLQQESDTGLAPEQRAVEAYSAHVERLVTSGTLDSADSVGLSSLGLLRPDEVDKRVAQLSTGQRRRLDLALVLAAKPQVLLLDEPTNHLSIALVDELTEALESTSAAVVLSSHDRQVLRDTRNWKRLELAAP